VGNIGSDRYAVAVEGGIAIAAFVRSLPRDDAFLLSVARDAVQTAFQTAFVSAPRSIGDELAVDGLDDRVYLLLPVRDANGGVHSLRIRQATRRTLACAECRGGGCAACLSTEVVPFDRFREAAAERAIADDPGPATTVWRLRRGDQLAIASTRRLSGGQELRVAIGHALVWSKVYPADRRRMLDSDIEIQRSELVNAGWMSVEDDVKPGA
jgi:hypothetical protein